MQLVADDLLCPSCQGYVHLFLERCPACGTERVSRFGQATATGSLGAAALLVDDSTERAVHFVVLRYSLRSNSTWSITELESAFGIVAGSLTYRAAVATEGPTAPGSAGPMTLDPASLVLVDGSLVVRAGPSGRAVAAVPLPGVLAATPVVKGIPAAASWAGVALGDRHLLPERPLATGDLLVTYAGGGSAGQLAIANRRGILAQTARPDHYATLARWIAILGAAAAEARWLEVGTAAYAAELGLGPAAHASTAAASTEAPGVRGAEAASLVGSVAAATTPPATSGAAALAAADRATAPVPGIRAALEELESLRGAGLVTADEYEAKRREILARL